MKRIFIFLVAGICCTRTAAAQEKPVKPLVQKTTATTTAQPVKVTTLQAEKKPPTPAQVNMDIQSASVSFITADDGKDRDTRMGIRLWDNNKRAAASYNMYNGSIVAAGNSAEYLTGATNTVPMTVAPSIPTGEIKMEANIPLPVLRMATPADFGSGGELRIDIAPNGHDTWKIKSITLHMGFNNDSNSPHTITWNSITLSQDSRYADLLFDKNFNPVQ